MDKNNLKDAYDIGENMAVFSGEGRSYTIINKETDKTRQLVSEDGSLLVTDNEIDFDAIYKGCPDFNGCKSVRYWFGRYDNFRNGVCAICWTVYPDGRYFADEDGFGMEDNDEENAYCIINKDLEIIVPFQPMDDVKEMLKKYALEADFFIRSTASLIPVEAKAKSGREKSMKTLITSGHYPDIRYGIKLSKNNIGHEDRIYTFPYFCTFLLKRFMVGFYAEEEAE